MAIIDKLSDAIEDQLYAAQAREEITGWDVRYHHDLMEVLQHATFVYSEQGRSMRIDVGDFGYRDIPDTSE